MTTTEPDKLLSRSVVYPWGASVVSTSSSPSTFFVADRHQKIKMTNTLVGIEQSVLYIIVSHIMQLPYPVSFSRSRSIVWYGFKRWQQEAI